MKKYLLIIMLISISSLYTQESKSAEDIIKYAEEQSKGETMIGTFTMNIIRPDYTRTLKMKNWNKGNDKALIKILYPEKEKGNKTLKIGNEMWQYLENTETTMKLPPSMMLRSWNGSDLTNDDLVRESSLINDYDMQILLEEKIAGEMCWKVELTPKEGKPIVWGKIYYWVRKSDKLPAYVQYYDEDGTLKRSMKFADFGVIDSRKIAKKWIVEDEENKGYKTEFIFNEADFNVDISDRVFSFRNLER